MRRAWIGLVAIAALVINATPRERSVEERIAGRSFPSVFQAWNPADNLKSEDPATTLGRHDLVFHAPNFFGLRWNNRYWGLGTGFTKESNQEGLARRAELLARNPNQILLAEIRYHDGWRTYLPDDSVWWKRDASGKPEPGWAEGQLAGLDYANPTLQKQVALQAKAAVESGVVDGVMLDWWKDEVAQVGLLKRIRTAIGPRALILLNSNDLPIPRSARYANGLFMECYRTKTVADWSRIENTLVWAERHLRRPRIDCLETWYHQSRADLNLMRATTCLALTRSDGYCLFTDPDPLPTPDHLHDWYPFWNRSLGRPRGPGKRVADGTVRREFDTGIAVYNPACNRSCTMTFPEVRTSVATGIRSRNHVLNALDGDLYLR